MGNQSSAEVQTAHVLKRVKQLRNAWHDGEFITERATDFWSQCRKHLCCGERKVFGSELHCQPLSFNGHSLLVCLTETNGKTWFSWIHPED